VPIEYLRLDNGLMVVVSPDHSAPVVCVNVTYHVGFRLEPQGRTGFAHLFEHMMFQGSEHLGKMELIGLVEANGGILNGTTGYDFTNYFEVMPKHALDLVLWAEADRMRGLRIAQDELDNQRDVVKNEIRVNVTNRPYGGFPAIDMPERVFENWHNSHNGYGDMADLDAATLEEAEAFFDAYYSPANAVIVLVGDIDPSEAFEMVRARFDDIEGGPAPAEPDLSEPPQTEARWFEKVDPLANRPALALSYQTPPRGSDEFFALGLLDEILLQGDDALLAQELVNRRGITSAVEGGINFFGSMYTGQTPLLWSAMLLHDAETASTDIAEIAAEVIDGVRTRTLEPAELEHAIVKARSRLYALMDFSGYPGIGLSSLLAAYALLEGDPTLLNRIEDRYAALTPDMLRATAEAYLAPEQRNVLALAAGASDE
jgi:predicted Zn-dependent peptidase